MKYCFGVDLGGTTVKMGLFTGDGEVLDKWEIPTRTANGGEAILPDIATSIKEKAAELNVQDIIGIGMGVPAPVCNGVVPHTANLGWGYKEVQRELEELTGIAVTVENDANIAALGEMWRGGGRGYKNMVMITLGTGVGGGIILDGHIFSGENGAAGELGHICVNYEETEICGCGRCGCLEQYASATGIVRLATRYLAECTDATVLNAEHVTAKDVFDAVKTGDAVAMAIAEQFGEYLGYALANIATVLSPEAFVIGGGVSKAGEVLLSYIQKYYVQRAHYASKGAKFVLAELGNDAGICGAAKLALEK